MSNHSDGDFGQIELDAAERADAEINLDDPSAGDDEPWSPPDRQPRGAEMAEVEDETLSMRVRQEDPDADAGYHDPDDIDMVGGDDADAVPADEDVVGGGGVIDPGSEEGPEAGALHLEP